MALIRKRRVWWEPVSGASEYVIYCGKDGIAFDPQHFKWELTPGILSKVVRGKAEIVIPDEWPEFPAEAGNYRLAVTARDEAGNESDPFSFEGFFKLSPPATPGRAGIETL